MGEQSSVDLSTPEAVQEATELATQAEAEARGEVTPTPEETPAPEAEAAETAESPESGVEIPEPTQQEAEEIAQKLDMEALSSEYANTGALSQESRATVVDTLQEVFGDTAENVLDAYLAGVEAQTATLTAQVHEAVGGAEQFSSMIEWASTNLSEAEIAAYNQAVNQPGMADIAARGLHAKFTAAVGTEPAAPSRVAPPAVTSAAAITVNSDAQLATLVSTPEYHSDPGHRAQVDAAIEAALKAGRIS